MGRINKSTTSSRIQATISLAARNLLVPSIPKTQLIPSNRFRLLITRHQLMKSWPSISSREEVTAMPAISQEAASEETRAGMVLS